MLRKTLQAEWQEPHAVLAQWALEETWFPIDKERIDQEEKDLLLATAETLGDVIGPYLANELYSAAVQSHTKYPYVALSMWTYYHYCRFLWKVLTRFGQPLRISDDALSYHEHFQEQRDVFNNMIAAVENVRPFRDGQTDHDTGAEQLIWTELDDIAARLASKYEQAILAASRHLKLPDFVEKRA